eukprot:GHVH01016294.1.p1 GENE.GHVH01016294.1~~GHVH01016294.1.p1  ORF type:complete len:501 (-),score=63.46 GHVH01016294.1:63-1565(-)
MKIVNLPVERHDEKRIIYSIIGVQASLGSEAAELFPVKYDKVPPPDIEHWSKFNGLYDNYKDIIKPWRTYLEQIDEETTAKKERTPEQYFLKPKSDASMPKPGLDWFQRVIEFQSAVQILIYQVMAYWMKVQKDMCGMEVDEQSRIERKYSVFLKNRSETASPEVWSLIDQRPILSPLHIYEYDTLQMLIPTKLKDYEVHQLQAFGKGLHYDFINCPASGTECSSGLCDCYFIECLVQRIRATLAAHFIICMNRILYILEFITTNWPSKLSRFDLIIIISQFDAFWDQVMQLNKQADVDRGRNIKSSEEIEEALAVFKRRPDKRPWKVDPVRQAAKAQSWLLTALEALAVFKAWFDYLHVECRYQPSDLTTHVEENDKLLKKLEESDIEGGQKISKLLGLLFDRMRSEQIDPVLTDNISEDDLELMTQIYNNSKETLNAITQDSSSEDPKKAAARADVISFVRHWMIWCASRVHQRSNHLTTHGKKNVQFHKYRQVYWWQ